VDELASIANRDLGVLAEVPLLYAQHLQLGLGKVCASEDYVAIGNANVQMVLIVRRA
jgi:hypothetical protein